ncbi:MAG: enoyl-[acyl-carrier-protein] reductase FabK [Chloroflexi bacterium]|nr:enoyl-[acyl-carrier-protein] reductase FabK [Chloroflexota bacterium]
MLRTQVCDILGIEYPIIQGGMAWLGTYELVSAVSEAGGLGTIGSGNAPGEWVRQQIRATRERTRKPFAVNVLMVSPFFKEVVDTVVEEKVPVVAFGAGHPGIFFPRLKAAGIKIMPVVSSVALAKRLQRSGADLLVAEGMESGGHIGETTTMALVPQVASAVQVPVVAAGGIADGRGLVAALALGAQGVQMGTRFICSEECIAHPRFKEKVARSGDRDTVVTGRPTGHPIRCLENKLARQFIEMEKRSAPVEEFEKLGTGKMPLGVIQGDLDGGSLMAGQICGMISDIKPARDIILRVMAEAEQTLSRLAALPSKAS